MGRLIDADELKKWAQRCIIDDRNAKPLEFKIDAVDVDDIDDMPTIDAIPVVHAHWKIVKAGLAPMQCSACGKITKDFDSGKFGERLYPNYCQHCGAKMDEEEDNGTTN